MKRNIIVLASLLFTLCVCAQQARKDFEKDKNLSAGNYVAYPGPQKVLTPAPLRAARVALSDRYAGL